MFPRWTENRWPESSERRHGSAVWILVLLLCSCGDGMVERRVDLLPVLEQGDVLATQTITELAMEMPGGGISGWLGEQPWRPMPIERGEGWGMANRAGWRPQGERSTLSIRPPLRSGSDQELSRELYLEINRRVLKEQPGAKVEPLDPNAELSVTVLWNGQKLGQADLPVGRNPIRLALPEHSVQSSNEVELLFDPPLQQPRGGPQPVALQRLGLPTAGADVSEPKVEWKIDRETERLQVSGAGTFTTSLFLPEGAKVLQADVRFHDPSGAMSWLAVTGDGERHELLEIEAKDDRKWRSQKASLEELAGQWIALSIETKGSKAVELRSPELVLRLPKSSAEESTDQADAKLPSLGTNPRPDIVVILLDAARGDRVANPDYPRQVTPNIDAMAEKENALVFRRAFSECPSTTCSIPNLITGLPFLKSGHGWGGRLDDRAETLAETLQSAGYRTVSFSANPHYSIARNLHQGFDGFYELWGGHKDYGPYGMSRRGAEVIHNTPKDQPLFLKLHYLPPHEPYHPLPQFDVFRDPDYDGPIKPGTAPMPFRRTREALSDADVQRFIDLYDGNFLMVDDAVSQIFTALKESGRWQNTVLLLTSDHGEAFWEHGEQGHNSNLFDEMLHIPFILWLPPTMGGDMVGIDTDRNVFLGDVVPTLLGRIGLKPSPRVTGIDLLAENTQGYRAPRIFHRTANPKTPILSARLPRFKAIVHPNRQRQYLFDMQTDHQEQLNAIGEQPQLYTALSLLIRRHKEVAESIDFDIEEAPLSKKDEEVLRSLGYL